MKKKLVKTSKFLSYVLRHRPESVGLSMDQNGWAGMDELIACAEKQGQTLTREQILEVVAENDKQRFRISDCGTKIRANQGHSINVDVELKAVLPPDILYHGTVAAFLESIRAKGLIPGNRLYVHLSKDEETAVKVGQRRGKPIILIVHAGRMEQDGHVFYLSENGVWLTKGVPPSYLEFP